MARARVEALPGVGDVVRQDPHGGAEAYRRENLRPPGESRAAMLERLAALGIPGNAALSRARNPRMRGVISPSFPGSRLLSNLGPPEQPELRLYLAAYRVEVGTSQIIVNTRAVFCPMYMLMSVVDRDRQDIRNTMIGKFTGLVDAMVAGGNRPGGATAITDAWYLYPDGMEHFTGRQQIYMGPRSVVFGKYPLQYAVQVHFDVGLYQGWARWAFAGMEYGLSQDGRVEYEPYLSIEQWIYDNTGITIPEIGVGLVVTARNWQEGGGFPPFAIGYDLTLLDVLSYGAGRAWPFP